MRFGLSVQQERQGGGAQLWLVQLAEICCVLHSSDLHSFVVNFSNCSHWKATLKGQKMCHYVLYAFLLSLQDKISYLKV